MHSLHKKVSAPNVLLPRSRDRTVLFHNGYVSVRTIVSSTMPRDVIGVVPSLVFKYKGDVDVDVNGIHVKSKWFEGIYTFITVHV